MSPPASLTDKYPPDAPLAMRSVMRRVLGGVNVSYEGKRKRFTVTIDFIISDRKSPVIQQMLNVLSS
jgi:hypothetical protein